MRGAIISVPRKEVVNVYQLRAMPEDHTESLETYITERVNKLTADYLFARENEDSEKVGVLRCAPML